MKYTRSMHSNYLVPSTFKQIKKLFFLFSLIAMIPTQYCGIIGKPLLA